MYDFIDHRRNARSQENAGGSPRQAHGAAEIGEEHTRASRHVCRNGYVSRKASMTIDDDILFNIHPLLYAQTVYLAIS